MKRNRYSDYRFDNFNDNLNAQLDISMKNECVIFDGIISARISGYIIMVPCWSIAGGGIVKVTFGGG